jgi:hypothetical protein
VTFDEGELEPAPISLVRLAPVAASSTGNPSSGSRSPPVRSPIVVRGRVDATRAVARAAEVPPGEHREPRRLAVPLGPALVWPPPTHGGAMWVGFVVGALALVVAVTAVVAASLGWDPGWPFP